jgi:uncharacterized protein YodC (DUF2158 family)
MLSECKTTWLNFFTILLNLKSFIAMAIKRFNPGDRVRHYGGGPVMQVMNYMPTKWPLIGATQSGYWVDCAWNADGKRHSQVFSQDVLIKVGQGYDLLNNQSVVHSRANYLK